MITQANCLRILTNLKRKLQKPLLNKHEILCETGDWMDSAVLKLQKKSWTQNGTGEGIFFSVWVGNEGLKKSRFHYNIHAFKTRLWEGHKIKPVEFASAFRSRLHPFRKDWPNLSLDYGPQTLMQGWQDLDLKTFEEEVSDLIAQFIAIHGLIDEMIDERRK